MLELTKKRLFSVLWMLKNKGKKWNIYELRKGAAEMLGADDRVHKKNTRFPVLDMALTYGPTFRFVKELEKNGYIAKDPNTKEYSVTRANDLVRLISLARPLTSLKTIPYHSPLDFEQTLKLINSAKLDYSFTLYAGSELYRAYVKTDQVHVYIAEGEEEKWAKYLLAKKCLKAEKSQANLFLLPIKDKVFLKGSAKIKGFSIVPTPILLSDLISFGGLAEEQGRFLMDAWLENRM